jgi:hypothetical protein
LGAFLGKNAEHPRDGTAQGHAVPRLHAALLLGFGRAQQDVGN